MAHGGSASQATQLAGMNDWRQAIETFYPEWNKKTYCVPPLYFNRVPYDTQHVAGLRVLVQQPSGGASSSTLPSQSSIQPTSSHQPTSSALRSFSGEPVRVQESDTRDDFAQQHVMHCVQALGETQHEPMFVISQLNYADYLNKPSYAQAARHLPRPFHLPKHDRHGDFDILIPHMHYGILIGEIKCVGLNMTQSDSVISKKVEQAVKQLKKSERVVRHITQDMAPGVRITNTLIFPYVTIHQMQQVIMADRNLQQAVCATLGAPDVTTAVQLCLCADQLSDKATPHHITPRTMTQLSGWFTRRVSGTVDPAMTQDVYINTLARIVGPATTIAVHCVTPPRVEVHTLGEGMSELGERLARVVLTPAQLHLINRLPCLPRVCLVGPPGTGKSLVLVLVGLHWLRAGEDVLVLSTSLYSRAVSHVIHRQLEMTLRQDPTPSAGTVRFLSCDLAGANETDVYAAVQSVITKTLHVLMDEANFSNLEIGLRYRQMVAELFRRVPCMSLWAATLHHADVPPSLHVETLTVPLRSAPVIVREVERAFDKTSGTILGYTASAVPTSDGPEIIRLRHEGGQHAGRWPIECRQCGLEVAHVLRHQLRVGVTGPVTSGGTTTSPPPLQYRDVLVLTRDMNVLDELKDEQGNTVKPASAFVAGLREGDEGLPVSVISCVDDSSSAKITDMAEAQTDQVNVAYYAATHGLERKVVVYLPGRVPAVEGRGSDEEMKAKDRLLAVSRCSSQLVMVDMPPTASASVSTAASSSGEDGFPELMERVTTKLGTEFATNSSGNVLSGATASTAAASADEAGLPLPDEIKQIMKTLFATSSSADDTSDNNGEDSHLAVGATASTAAASADEAGLPLPDEIKQIMKAVFPTSSSADDKSDNNGEDSPLAVGASASTATTSADAAFVPDPIKQFIETMTKFATTSSAVDMSDDDGRDRHNVASGNVGSAHYIAVPLSDSDLAAFMQEVPRMMMQFETTASNTDDKSDNDGEGTPPAAVATAGTTHVTEDTESDLATVLRQTEQSAATSSIADDESDNDGESTPPAAGATATASDSSSATVSDLKTLGLANSSPTNISDDHGDDKDDEDGNVSDSVLD